MDYLFFDIECADGHRAICEFGYVLTNDKFEIKRKVNILFDPECKFNLTNRTHQKDLILTYPETEYLKFYPFYDSYDRIKSLLTSKNLMVFGYSVSNDINFLNKDSNRYKLPIMNFDSYDIQKILKELDKEKKLGKSLECVAEKIVAESELVELKDHRACDDAAKTMLVFKALICEFHIKPDNLIEMCNRSKVNSLETLEETKRKNIERSLFYKKKNLQKKGHELYQQAFTLDKDLIDKDEFKGKTVIVSQEMQENLKELKEILSFAKDKGYVIYDHITGSNFFIVFDKDDTNLVKSKMKYDYAGEIITYKDFIDRNM